MERLRPNAMRVGLVGEAAGFVNSIDAKRASDALAQRLLKVAARREAARSAGPVHSSPAPMSERPRRLSLSDLRAAAMARKAAAS
jgi:sRNA-binding protein